MLCGTHNKTAAVRQVASIATAQKLELQQVGQSPTVGSFTSSGNPNNTSRIRFANHPSNICRATCTPLRVSGSPTIPINTATPGSRVKHPGTGPSSGSTLQAVDLQTIEGSCAEVRYTPSSRSGRRRARRAWSLITQRTKTATYLHDDSPN